MKIKVSEIHVERLEGYTEECITVIRKTFYAANEILKRNALTAPDDGSYDKHKIKVVFADGETYEARIDLHHTSYEKTERIEDHISWFCRFHSGMLRPEELPKHIKPETYPHAFSTPEQCKSYCDFLNTYQLED
jgi:hypothetical protein